VWSDVNQPWHVAAACLGLNTEMFYPYRTDIEGVEQVRPICMRCPVRQQCLQFAIDNDERFGVWGGMSAIERNQLVNP